MKKLVLAALLILSAMLVTGCMGDAEKHIQGTWEYNSEHLLTKTSEQHLTLVWFFSNGTFSYQACCFNIDEEVTGRYRVLDVEDNIITLELYNTRGSQYRYNTELRIKIDKETGDLTIQGGSPYRKLEPSG